MIKKTYGLVKMKADAFDEFNKKAAEIRGGCKLYTFSYPDADPLYVWAVIEDEGLTEEPLISKEDAIASGMVYSTADD